MEKPQVIAAFPTVLLRTRLAAHSVMAAQLSPELRRIRETVPNGPGPGWACPVYTTLMTDSALHQRCGFEAMVEAVVAEVRAFATRKSVFPQSVEKIGITRCWLTVLKRGDSLDINNQPNSLYTAVYFVQAPTDGARFCLHNPANERGLSLPVLKPSALNQEQFTLRPTPGELLVFESHLLQSLMVHESSVEQILLTFTAAGPLW